MFLALMKRFRQNESGFTLIELMVVVAIIALLAVFAVPKLFEAINSAKAAPGKADLNTLASAMDRHYLAIDKYPFNATADATTIMNKLKEGYVKSTTTFKNGFGKGYVYYTDAAGSYYILADAAKHEGAMTITCGSFTNTTAVVGTSFVHVVTTGTAPTAAELRACAFTSSVTGFVAADVRYVTN